MGFFRNETVALFLSSTFFSIVLKFGFHTHSPARSKIIFFKQISALKKDTRKKIAPKRNTTKFSDVHSIPFSVSIDVIERDTGMEKRYCVRWQKCECVVKQ